MRLLGALLDSSLKGLGVREKTSAEKLGKQICELVRDLDQLDFKYKVGIAKELGAMEVQAKAAVPALIKLALNDNGYPHFQEEVTKAIQAAVEALGKIGQPAIDELVKIVSNDPQPDRRVRAIYLLGTLGGEREVTFLQNVLNSSLEPLEPVGRVAVLEALKSVAIRAKHSIPAVNEEIINALTTDKDPGVRLTAVNVLIYLPGTWTAAIPILQRLKGDPALKETVSFVLESIDHS